MAVSLRDGVSPEAAAIRLRDLGDSAFDIKSFADRLIDQFQKRYLSWIIETEQKLREISPDPSVADFLQTNRYWHIAGARLSQPLYGLILAEIDVQGHYLNGLGDRLMRLAEQMTKAPGTIVVLDTNILLHYQDIKHVKWQEVIVGEPLIRLVIPLGVIKELDQKKYSSNKGLASKARALLPRLDQLILPGEPGKVRDGVTVEVPLENDEQPALQLDADGETLDLCQLMKRITGEDVILVTGDTGMTLRAGARNIKVVRMPDKYLAQETVQ